VEVVEDKCESAHFGAKARFEIQRWKVRCTGESGARKVRLGEAESPGRSSDSWMMMAILEQLWLIFLYQCMIA